MTTSIVKVGFVGLGNMGWPMASRLATDHSLSVFDTDTNRADRFVAEVGGVRVDTCATLAANSDVVITMLPSSAVVDAVLFGKNSIAQGARPGLILLEMSSGVPSATRAMAERAGAFGITIIDAPVSGGVPRAETGELAIMVGGPADGVATIEPILSRMGTTILRTGSTGTAHAMKALNNMVSAAGFLIGIEALLVGQKFGVEPGTMVDVLNAATGTNNSTQKKFHQYVLSRAFNSGFGLDLMVKDLSIAADLANEVGATTPFTSLCRDMWAAARAHLGEGHDHTAMALFSEHITGEQLGRKQGEQ